MRLNLVKLPSDGKDALGSAPQGFLDIGIPMQPILRAIVRFPLINNKIRVRKLPRKVPNLLESRSKR